MKKQVDDLVCKVNIGNLDSVSEDELEAIHKTLGVSEQLSNLEYDLYNILDNNSFTFEEKKEAINQLVSLME